MIAAAFVLIPFLIGIKNYRLYGKDLRVLTIFMGVSVLTEILAYSFFYQGKNNYPFLHVFTIIEFAALTYIYSLHLRTILSYKVILVLVLSFILYSVLNSIFIQSIYQFNTYARGVEFILLILFALLYFYTIYINEVSSITKVPMFWINLGVLVYYTSSFFVVLVMNQLFPQMKFLWGVHNILLVTHYTLFSIALWIKPKV